MGLFSKPEVVILKESTATEHYLQQLKELQPQARGNAAKKLSAEISAVDAGLFGERNVLYELKHSGMDMVVLHDLYLKSSSGNTAQIDFFVLTPKLNFVIECKNLWGNIEITDTGSFVRVRSYNGQEVKEGIYSPLTQNQHHLQVLKECRSERKTGLTRAIGNLMFDSAFKSLVVLANPKTILENRNAPKEVKDQVIRADQLNDTIKRMNRDSNMPASSLKELLSFGQSYLALHVDEQPDRIGKFRELLAQETQ